MDGLQALALLKRQITDQIATQADLARDIGVSEATVSRWYGADRPMRGSSLKALVDWAERAQAAQRTATDAIPTAIIVKARQLEAETHRDLARIYGYAESIADLADQVSSKQRGLLEMLKPWVDTETDVRAGKIGAVLAGLAKLDEEDAAGGTGATPAAPADAAPARTKGRRKSAG